MLRSVQHDFTMWCYSSTVDTIGLILVEKKEEEEEEGGGGGEGERRRQW